MSQQRIRTLKPENWADEAITALSRDARLLRDVLITFADDDGRWRHRPTAIIGFGYPEDEDVTPRLIRKWTDELCNRGVAIVWECDGREYGCFPKWHLHQQINKYRPSQLPECPDSRVVSYDEARQRKGRGREPSGSPTGIGTGEVREDSHPPAQARCSGSGSSSPDPVPVVEDARANVDDERVRDTLTILRGCKRLTFDLEAIGVINALAAFPGVDHCQAAHTAVMRASDPSYRTTDAGRVLWYALADLDKRAGQVQSLQAAHSKRGEHPVDIADQDLAQLAEDLRQRGAA